VSGDENLIPTFENVEETERRWYNFYRLGFRNGVRQFVLFSTGTVAIATLAFATVFPPTIENWLFYLVPTGIVFWLMHRMDTEHRSISSYLASKIRKMIRPKVTWMGRPIQKQVYQNPQQTWIVDSKRDYAFENQFRKTTYEKG
jgi:hypothetical protein